ncbi:hypothetical protein PI125_g796 [Phytophthora idaei]|nr:hypothetical protein PI125_g796 [Phytophthora idaei]
MCLKPMEPPMQSAMEFCLPAEAAAEVWKWKSKLRRAFGGDLLRLGKSA